MVLAFGGTSHGSNLPSPACSYLPPALNQASYSLSTSLGIANISSRCMSLRFPAYATLLHCLQSLVVEEDCTGQVLDRCQLGRGETYIGLGGISLWQENQSHKHIVIQPW